jgi:hypothetical protein
VTTKDIRTSQAYTVCDVCGRTLLRGERAEVYLNGGSRRSVCELCKDRALHEGWVREGTVAAYDEGDSGNDRRRSLFGRFRRGRDSSPPPTQAPTLRDELDSHSWSQTADAESEPEPVRSEPARAPEPVRAEPSRPREPRHVRAVPTSNEQKAAQAVQLFNGSEHRRTVSGVARSLGPPWVSVRTVEGQRSAVQIVVSWELCWYRYEVELSDDEPSVRPAGQGYELDELTAEEQQANAAADEQGSLVLGA